MESLKPSAEALARIESRRRLLGPVFLAGTRTFVRFTTEGMESVPKSGPLVILANHVSALDGPSINALLGRSVLYLASQGMLRKGKMASFMGGLGVIPKKKFMSDARAVRALKGWVDTGAAVGIFPEGERSWDGRTLPFVPGIEKLVRLLGAPVVTCRIHNADRIWPRWASKPRRGRIHLAFDPPVQFERRAPPAEILAYIRERITLNPDQNQRWPVRGRNLALGLPNVIYCCPACSTMEGLEASANEVGCTACGQIWRVDTTNTLHPLDEGSPLTVAEAADRARDLFASHGVQDQGRFEAEGVVMESETLTLTDQGGEESVEIGQGRLQLTRDALRLVGSEVEWSLPLEDIRTVSIEMTRGLWIMTADSIYEPVMPRESVIKWRDALVHWMAE